MRKLTSAKRFATGNHVHSEMKAKAEIEPVQRTVVPELLIVRLDHDLRRRIEVDSAREHVIRVRRIGGEADGHRRLRVVVFIAHARRQRHVLANVEFVGRLAVPAVKTGGNEGAVSMHPSNTRAADAKSLRTA